MLLSLVKKDFMLIKKNALIMMLFVFVIPLFVAWRVPILLGFPTLLLAVIYSEIILCQGVSIMEAKYPKASALLCAAPYSRSTVVKAKYVFALFIFIYCYIAYSLIALIVPQVGTPDLFTTLTVLLVVILLYGIYLPIEFKLGFQKTKFALMITVFVLSFGLPMLYGKNIKIDLSWLSIIPVIAQYLVLSVISITIVATSMAVSIRIYNKKEL